MKPILLPDEIKEMASGGQSAFDNWHSVTVLEAPTSMLLANVCCCTGLVTWHSLWEHLPSTSPAVFPNVTTEIWKHKTESSHAWLCHAASLTDGNVIYRSKMAHQHWFSHSRYIAVQNNTLLHTAQQLLRWNFGHTSTHERHPYLALTGELWVSFVSYLEFNDHEISGTNCIGDMPWFTRNNDQYHWRICAASMYGELPSNSQQR